MAYELGNNPFDIGAFVASTDFDSTDQFTFVNLSTATNDPPDVRVVATSGAQVFGILQEDSPSSGVGVLVRTFGPSKLRFSSTHAAVTVGSAIYSRDNGTGQSGTSSSFHIAAYALEDLAADTSGVISVFLLGPTVRSGTS